MDTENENAQSSGSVPDSASSSTRAATAAPIPLELKKGMRIQIGYRRGTVESVRGGWSKPYDVRVRWDGEKYPQWILHRTLEADHESGKLKRI